RPPAGLGSSSPTEKQEHYPRIDEAGRTVKSRNRHLPAALKVPHSKLRDDIIRIRGFILLPGKQQSGVPQATRNSSLLLPEGKTQMRAEWTQRMTRHTERVQVRVDETEGTETYLVVPATDQERFKGSAMQVSSCRCSADTVQAAHVQPITAFSSWSGIVSLISLVVLSYDRYSTLAVYQKHGPDYRKPLMAVGGSWLYSLVWTVPPLLGWSSYGLEGAGTSCSVSWTQQTAQSHAYIICLFIFCLGLPVLVMVYCYGRLLYAVKQVGKIRKSAARKREYHVLFMVLTTVVCYLLCWMPYGVVAMMATFGRPGIISPVASVIPSLLAKSSTVINPLIYILMNKQFYRCFRILFCCQSRLLQNSNSSMQSKTTVIQLNRRVHSNAVACMAQISTGIHNHDCSTPATERSGPLQITS
ncbi:hypothetical protein DNTS_035740, partial [Danionella cerebrum]